MDFHIEKKGKGQVCNFCGTSCLRENLPRHYSKVHRAEAWSNLTFPGPNAFKRYCESDDATLCLICRHEENGPSNGLVFIDIAQHLQKFHKFSESELPAFLKEKEQCNVQETFVSVSTIASELLQGGESQKRKCMESRSGVWKRSRSPPETQLQKFQPKFITAPQQPNLFHVRVPYPHYGGPRMPHMPFPPPWNMGAAYRAPGPPPHHSIAPWHDPPFYLSPGEDGWRMWR